MLCRGAHVGPPAALLLRPGEKRPTAAGGPVTWSWGGAAQSYRELQGVMRSGPDMGMPVWNAAGAILRGPPPPHPGHPDRTAVVGCTDELRGSAAQLGGCTEQQRLQGPGLSELQVADPTWSTGDTLFTRGTPQLRTSSERA
eukprot:356579-Chlamydomonas_euryale.AAC.4